MEELLKEQRGRLGGTIKLENEVKQLKEDLKKLESEKKSELESAEEDKNKLEEYYKLKIKDIEDKQKVDKEQRDLKFQEEGKKLAKIHIE